MRVNLGRGQIVALWVGMILLCTFAPEAVAGALQASTSEICGAAVALGLALLKEANGDPK
jgi:hypothetical protein